MIVPVTLGDLHALVIVLSGQPWCALAWSAGHDPRWVRPPLGGGLSVHRRACRGAE